MNEQDIEVLKTSKDQRVLKKIANKLAASELKDDIGFLVQLLNNSDFLGRLDTPEDYEMTYASLRLASTINVLMSNSAEAAPHALLYLTSASNFLGNILRIQLLVHAFAVIRPLPKRAVDYLNTYSTPESPLTYDVVECLCENQSQPAMQLLEQKFVHLQLPDNYQKVSWMRQQILPRRNDERLLECCENLVSGSLPNNLKVELVDVLFDYKPEEWYVGCDKPKPPARELTSGNAKQILQRIAQTANAVLDLTPDQREQIQSVIDQFHG